MRNRFEPPDIKLLPEEVRPYADAYNAAFQAYLDELNLQIDRTMQPSHAAVAVPATTIDVGSAVLSGTAAAIAASFAAMALPNTATTSAASIATALDYTGRGILQRVVCMSQTAAATSTAAGFTVKITIDGNVIYNAATTASNNRIAAVVGSLTRDESALSTDIIYGSMDDVPGLPFNSGCKIEFQTGTNGQGITIGWRVLKKL